MMVAGSDTVSAVPSRAGLPGSGCMDQEQDELPSLPDTLGGIQGAPFHRQTPQFFGD